MQLAHGATPIIETMHAYLHDDTGVAAVADLFSVMNTNEELFYEYQPVPDIALLFSAQSMIGDHEYLAHYQGAFQALTHDHQQFSVILDEDLTIEKLSRYNVIFLSQAVCLSDTQLKAIEAFVRQGGGLVATGKTSLCDSNDVERDNFGLAELFGADHRGMADPEWLHAYGPRVYDRITGSGEVIERPAAGRLIAHDYTFAFGPAHHAEGVEYSMPQIVCRGSETTVVAEAVWVDEDPAWTARSFMPPYSLRAAGPSATAQTYGDGRVIYMAHSVDRLYGARGFADVRHLINSAVDWVSPRANRALRVQGPTGLLCNLTELDGARALHLINYTGNINEGAIYKVDWVPPLMDVPVTLEQPKDRKLQSASLLTSGATVPWQEAGDSVLLSLSIPDGYECLLLNYE